MDIKNIIKLVYRIDQNISKVNEALADFKESVVALKDYAEEIRLEQRTEMEAWLESTLTILYESERTDIGQIDGYDHYSIRNDHVNAERYIIAAEKKDRSIEETQQSFVSTVLELLQKYNGKKLIVRKLPEYQLTEEGEHIFRCRLHFEKVN